LAYGCRDLGEHLLAAGRPAEADGFLRRSEEAFRRIIAGHGVSDGGLQFQLAVVLSGRANAARGRGDVESCLRLKREAVSLLDTARQARPFSPAYMRRQCEYLEDMAGSLTEVGRNDEALTLLEKARRTATTMASSFPDLGDLRKNQAELSAGIARLLLQMRRDSDAEQAFRESLRVYQETVAAYPEVSAYRQGEVRIRQELEALLKSPGGLDRAGQGAATLRGSDPTPARMNLNRSVRPR